MSIQQGKFDERNLQEIASKVELFSDAIVDVIYQEEEKPQVVYRAAGDTYLLVVYEETYFNMNLTFRVYELEEALKANKVSGIVETAPGVHSLLINYDNLEIPLQELLKLLKTLEDTLPPLGKGKRSSRIVYLPIAYRDRWTKDAVAKYIRSVRSEAPYLPDNVEFLAKCNGLDKTEDVIELHTTSKHMVLALGDVYLGSPCAATLDPLHRLITPKYNPARTMTPEGAVGIGGPFVCHYAMESPGGYQLIGRSVPIWNTYQTSPAFEEAPWLLKPFDRIQYEAVTEDELEKLREQMLSGEYSPKIEEGVFDLEKYNAYYDSIRNKVEEFRQKQYEAVAKWTVDY